VLDRRLTEEVITRVTTKLLKLVILLVVLAQPVQLTPAQAAATQPVPWHPCARITAACSQAGFVPNGAKRGLGLMLDCIRPIMTETPQRKQATKALPQIDPQVVAACKARNPNFGKARAAKSQPSSRPTPEPSSTALPAAGLASSPDSIPSSLRATCVRLPLSAQI